MRSILQLLEDVAQLPDEQKLTLANRVLALTEPEPSEDVARLWDIEIRNRIERYDRGEARSRPVEDVLSDLDRKLGL